MTARRERFAEFLSLCNPAHWWVRCENAETRARATVPALPTLDEVEAAAREKIGNGPLRLKLTRRPGVRPEQFDSERAKLGLQPQQGGPRIVLDSVESEDDEDEGDEHEREAAPENPPLDDDDDAGWDDEEDLPGEPSPKRIRRQVAATRAKLELRRLEIEMERLGQPMPDPFAGLAAKAGPWIGLLAPVLRQLLAPRESPELLRLLGRLEAQQKGGGGGIAEALATIKAVRELMDDRDDDDAPPATALGEAAQVVREATALVQTMNAQQPAGQVIAGPRPLPTPLMPAPLPTRTDPDAEAKRSGAQALIEALLMAPETEQPAATARRTFGLVSAHRWIVLELCYDESWENLWPAIRPYIAADAQQLGDSLPPLVIERIEEWAEATVALIDGDEAEEPSRAAAQ